MPYDNAIVYNHNYVKILESDWSSAALINRGNSTVSRVIWDKYREWYFKIHQNITSRGTLGARGSIFLSRGASG